MDEVNDTFDAINFIVNNNNLFGKIWYFMRIHYNVFVATKLKRNNVRWILYPTISVALGLLLFSVIPVGSLTGGFDIRHLGQIIDGPAAFLMFPDPVLLFLWFIESSVAGLIFILIKEQNEGWTTKLRLIGVTMLLSIPMLVMFMIGSLVLGSVYRLLFG